MAPDPPPTRPAAAAAAFDELYGLVPLVLGVRPKVETGCAPAGLWRFEGRSEGRDLAVRRCGIEKTDRRGGACARGERREAERGVRGVRADSGTK